MIDIKDKKQCSGCSACANICNQKCIKMIADDEGFLYPKVELDKCINCNLCEDVCPIHKKKITLDKTTLAYAAKNKIESIHKDSSSGGIFTLLAEFVLKQGGIVFGAAFDEHFKIKHVAVETIGDLYKLRGSKYTQSIVGHTYVEARKNLKEGRLVLYTGTPCQIAGLKAYLKKDYPNLFTQDLICHGVPSPAIWKKYIEYRETISQEKVHHINFRNKDNGWKEYEIVFSFEKNRYQVAYSKDIYMKAFLKNLCLRPSCYDCRFKGLIRDSDITLADFWGIENILPEMDDNKGTSLVLIHSNKGKQLFEKIKADCLFQEVDVSRAIAENPSAIQSSYENKNRKAFMKDIQRKSLEKVVHKYTKKSFISKVKNKIRRILKWGN